jgi:hypothetical protein
MDGWHSVLIGSKFDSFAYIGIFPPTSDWSWMNDCCPFPISKWRNPIRPTLCSKTPSLAHRKIGATNWKGCRCCPTLHWMTSCACTSWWSTWCVGHCCTTRLGCATQCWSPQSPLRTRSDQDGADTCLTRLRSKFTAPPWQAHATQ